MAASTVEDIIRQIGQFPRTSLIHLPTPFRKLEALSAELGGPEVWVKRDDLTGLAFGGNKSRKLEFILTDALNKGADAVITWASLQSNWCLQTAAAARRFGIKPILILFKTSDLAPDYDGNLLLDYILGADIRIREAEKGKVVSQDYAAEVVEEVAGELRRAGRRPYIVSVGGSMPGFSMERPLGAISYVAAFMEMWQQARTAGLNITHLVHATGSGATQAGLAAGASALQSGIQVIGISVSDKKEPFTEIVLEIARQTEAALNIRPGLRKNEIVVLDDYIREGYGIINKDVADVLRLVFSREGIVLDPIYTGKAMAALVDLVNKGFFKKGDKIVFFHTGGTPALFPYRQKLVELLK